MRIAAHYCVSLHFSGRGLDSEASAIQLAYHLTFSTEILMSKFIRVVDEDKRIFYINASWIVLVRPTDGRDFDAMGAEIHVAESNEMWIIRLPPGDGVDQLLSALV